MLLQIGFVISCGMVGGQGRKRPVLAAEFGFFWLDEKIVVEVRHVHQYFLHLGVTLLDGRKWDLIAMYASPHADGRRLLWPTLDRICVEGPWLLIGDINCTLKAEKRNTLGRASPSFVQWVEGAGLVDLGYSGPKFTWCHGTSVHVHSRRAA